MTAKDLIDQGLARSEFFLEKYLEGLDDADLTLVPIEGMNPIAWQLGHLISTDTRLLEMIRPGAALPPGFAEAHPRDPSASSGAFLTKAEYFDLHGKVRAATRAVLETMDDAGLDTPSPEAVRKNFPLVGNMLNLMGQHAVLHAGQFVAVRRALKKPIAF
ncbi:DinB family protein [Isosphaeraceae bacterium EP7]